MTDEKEQFPTQEEISVRAYEIYLERGSEDGHADEHWLMAEEELTVLMAEKSPPLKSKSMAAGRDSGRGSTGGEN